MSQGNKKNNSLLLGSAIGILLLSGFFFYQPKDIIEKKIEPEKKEKVTEKVRKVSLSPKEEKEKRKETLEFIENKRTKLNDRLKYLELTEVSYPRIEDFKADKRFVLQIKESWSDGIYFFEGEEYVHKSSDKIGGDPIKTISINDICKIIEILTEDEYRKSKYLDALEKMEVDLGVSGFAVKNIEEVVWETLFGVDEMIDVNVDEILILIKGYADGERKSWSNPLLDSPYDYMNILVHKVSDNDSNRVEPMNYKEKLDSFIVEKVDNRTIPNLRSQYMKDEYLDRMCDNKSKTKVEILDGFSFKENTKPQNRKVQIFIQYKLNK